MLSFLSKVEPIIPDFTTDEALLIKQAQKGDMAAFETLVRRHERRVYNTALQMLGNTRDAEDCAQEAFIKMYRYLPEYAARARFSTWLYRVTINACTDFLRKAKRQNAVSLEKIQEDGHEWAAPPQDQPENQLMSAETRAHIRNCLAALPEEYRAAVILRDIQGLSYDEIAQALGCSLGTIKSRIFRGRHLLRKMLE